MSHAAQILDAISGQLPWQVELYKHFHQHPELGLAEHETSARIASELGALGYEIHKIGGTGIVGVLANGAGPVVLARADIDALPVTENTGLDYPLRSMASCMPAVMTCTSPPSWEHRACSPSTGNLGPAPISRSSSPPRKLPQEPRPWWPTG